MPGHSPLSPHFEYDGESELNLNRLQGKTKSKIEEKIKRGEYRLEAVPCPVCAENEEFHQVSKKDRFGLYHPVVICKGCGLVQSRPRLTRESYADFYREDYRLLYHGKQNWKDGLFDSQYERAKSVYDYISEHEEFHKDDTVLDVGAGTGGMVSYFQDRGLNCVGCDLDSTAVNYAQSKGIPVEEGTVEDVDVENQPDIVILSHIIEHFLQPIEEIQKVVNKAADDALFFIEVPGLKSIKGGSDYYGSDLLKQLQIAHVYYFSKITLGNLLGEVRGIAQINMTYAPALERGEEFGHIRALYRRKKNDGTSEIVRDYENILSHFHELYD